MDNGQLISPHHKEIRRIGADKRGTFIFTIEQIYVWETFKEVCALNRKAKAAPVYVAYQAKRPSKYQPHQGGRECARRLRPIAATA